MGSAIKFGTDGWRAVIAEDYTFENVRLCAQAIAEYLGDTGLGRQGLVVGYDTRFASEDFAAAVAEVAAANGVRVYLCDRAAPTPVVTYAVQTHNAGGAVIITASHNPWRWNGLKYRVELAAAASPDVLADIEARISRVQSGEGARVVPLDDAVRSDMVEMFDPSAPYLAHIRQFVDLEALRNAGLKVTVDPMYGAGAGYLATILRGGSTQIAEIHGERNPLFPRLRPEPIGTNLSELCATVRETGAGVGLATDGDADRIGVVDENGTYLTTLQVFALLALYLLEVRGQRGPIVKTITASAMLYRLGELYGVPVHETAVGFKYVAPKMVAEDAMLGGEESGGYAFRGHVLERDGILSGLFFLDLMVKLEKRPSELIDYLYSKVGPHYYDRVDVEFPAEKRRSVVDRLGNKPDRIDDVEVAEVQTEDGYRFLLGDGSWLLIRFSGTEPLLRIYAESDSPRRVEALLNAGRTMAGV